MARKQRISYPGALHHVIVRGNHKEEIFLYDRDRQKFIALLEEYHERYLFKCYAYSLMPNHIHLLIEEGDITLSKIMQGINQSYTQYFNTKYEKVGHLFQGRYKPILVDKERYLLVVVRYIHLNPVRALLVKRPEDYIWSSHHLYVSSDEESFIDKDYVLSLFGKTRKEAVKRYVAFIYEGIRQKACPEFESGYFLADDKFIENVTKEYNHCHKKKVSISLDEITSIVMETFCVDRQQLFSKSRERSVSFSRGVIGYLAREIAGISTKEIGSYFKRDPSALTNLIRGVISKMRKEPEIGEKIEGLKAQIKKKAN
jgi:putative transposase